MTSELLSLPEAACVGVLAVSTDVAVDDRLRGPACGQGGLPRRRDPPCGRHHQRGGRGPRHRHCARRLGQPLSAHCGGAYPIGSAGRPLRIQDPCVGMNGRRAQCRRDRRQETGIAERGVSLGSERPAGSGDHRRPAQRSRTESVSRPTTRPCMCVSGGRGPATAIAAARVSIHAFDVQGTKVANGRDFLDMTVDGVKCRPDGMRTDVAGNYGAARTGRSAMPVCSSITLRAS